MHYGRENELTRRMTYALGNKPTARFEGRSKNPVHLSLSAKKPPPLTRETADHNGQARNGIDILVDRSVEGHRSIREVEQPTHISSCWAPPAVKFTFCVSAGS
jgi:hypothetical protein